MVKACAYTGKRNSDSNSKTGSNSSKNRPDDVRRRPADKIHYHGVSTRGCALLHETEEEEKRVCSWDYRSLASRMDSERMCTKCQIDDRGRRRHVAVGWEAEVLKNAVINLPVCCFLS